MNQQGGGEPINTYFVDSDPNPALTQDGSTDKSWIVGRRCLAKKTDNGVAVCYLDENNSELFHDGVTPAVLDGTMGQWMTDLPEYYFHVDESVEGTHKFQVLPTEQADWKKSRRVLLGVTKAVNQDGKLWSLKGVSPTGRMTLIESRDYTTSLGDGFHIIDYETHCKIAHLFVSKYMNRNPQGMEQFGPGKSSTSRTNGSTSVLGNNDGKTDTQISFLGVEDFYGGKDEWMGGIHGYCSTYYIYDGYETSEVPTVPYREIEVGSTNIVGYISKVCWGENGDIIPIEAKGSSSSYYFDSCYVGRCPKRSVMRSGSSSGAYCGIFSFTANQSSSYSDASVGTRIQYRGNIEVIDDPATFIAMPVGF